MKRFGDLLRIHLESRGWSQFELAKKSGTSHQNVGLWVRNKTTPGHDGVGRMVRALGLNLEEEIELTLAAAREGTSRPEAWDEIERRATGEARPAKQDRHRLVESIENLVKTGSPQEVAELGRVILREKVFRSWGRRRQAIAQRKTK